MFQSGKCENRRNYTGRVVVIADGINHGCMLTKV